MYSTITEILKDISQDELLRLTNDENSELDEIDLTDEDDVCAVRVVEQIRSADEEIDGYLRSRYTLPFTTTPGRLLSISKDIAIYNLYKRRFRLELPESIVTIYNKRVSELEKIQRGIINLDIPSEDAPESEIVINKSYADRLFPKETLDLY